MVIDTSALLAVYFEEAHGDWALEQMNLNSTKLLMSSINYAESLILVNDRQPGARRQFVDTIRGSSIRFVTPSAEQAEVAAAARSRYPLNFGDCFAYALAKEAGCPLLTLDRDFRSTDLDVVLPVPHTRK